MSRHPSSYITMKSKFKFLGRVFKVMRSRESFYSMLLCGKDLVFGHPVFQGIKVTAFVLPGEIKK